MNPDRRLVILSALRWFPVGLVIPVLVLMLGSRGLTLAQVGQVMALYGITTLTLELPTGGLADSWGRKQVIVGSAVMQVLGLLALAFLGHLPFVILAVALLGGARALSSGPVESWFVDTMHASGALEVEPGLAKGQVAESLALGAGAIIGGFLPRLGVGLPTTGTGFIALSVPFLIGAVMAVVHGVAAWLLLTSQVREPGSVGRTVTQGIKIAVRQPNVRRLLLITACLGVVLSGVELLAPGRFADLVGSPTAAAGVFGVLSAAAFAAAAAGAASSTRLPGPRFLVGAAGFAALGLLALGLALPVLAGAATTYLALYVCVGLQGPVMAGLLHSRIASEVRATMMSVESLAMQAGGVVASLLVGAVATRSGELAGLAVISAAALVAAAILVRDGRRADAQSV